MGDMPSIPREGWSFDPPRQQAPATIVPAQRVCQGCGAPLKLLQGGACAYCMRVAQ